MNSSNPIDSCERVFQQVQSRNASQVPAFHLRAVPLCSRASCTTEYLLCTHAGLQVPSGQARPAQPVRQAASAPRVDREVLPDPWTEWTHPW